MVAFINVWYLICYSKEIRLSLLVPYVLLCDKNLPACSSAIIVLTAPLVLNLIYVVWALFFHWNSQALPFLLTKLTKHRVAQAQFEDSIFLMPRVSMFKINAFLLPPTNFFRVHSHTALWIWQRRLVVDMAGHRHWARFVLTAWPWQHLPHKDADYNREKPKSSLGSELGCCPSTVGDSRARCPCGKDGMDSAKASRKFSTDCWGGHDFLAPALLDSLLVCAGELREVRRICWRKCGTFLTVNGKPPCALGRF